MSKLRCLAVALFCSLVAVPTIARAQSRDSTKDQAQDFMHDVLGALTVPHWNVFVQGGFATGERYVLQTAVNTVDGQRALEPSTGYNLGLGAGVDILTRLGFRINYAFSSSNLNFKTDNGNGSSALNIDDVGTIKTNTINLEVMSYMLPSRSAFTPYGTLGVQGTWWSLHEKSALLTSNGTTPFAIGPLFSFGVQVKAAERWSGRAEMSLSSGHNPFTGSTSFRAVSGPTIDEPASVSRTEYRLAAVYYFGKAKSVTGTPATVAHK
jgi:hypothetical protein